MKFISIYYIYYFGVGAYFATLSPFIHDSYGDKASIIFLASQLAFPLGYFAAGYISDRFRLLRDLLLVGSLSQVIFQYLLFAKWDSLAVVAGLSALTRFFFAFNFQLLTIAAIEERGLQKFGIYRSIGTAGFFTMQLALFLLERYSVLDGLGLSSETAAHSGQLGSLFYIIVFVFSFLIKKERLSQEQYNFRAALQLTRHPKMLFFYVVSFFYYFSYQVVDFYIGDYFQQSGGMELVYLGWMLAVLLEIPLLPLSVRLYQFHSGQFLFIASTLVGALRLGLLASDASGQLSIPVVYTQILHGIHFTGYYMGAILFMRNNYPEHLYGTGFGLYMIFVVALGGMGGNLFSGILLYEGADLNSFGIPLEFDAGFEQVFGAAALIQLLLFIIFSIRAIRPAIPAAGQRKN